MNGNSTFVISSPYLGMMLHWEDWCVYVTENKMCHGSIRTKNAAQYFLVNVWAIYRLSVTNVCVMFNVASLPTRDTASVKHSPNVTRLNYWWGHTQDNPSEEDAKNCRPFQSIWTLCAYIAMANCEQTGLDGYYHYQEAVRWGAFRRLIPHS